MIIECPKGTITFEVVNIIPNLNVTDHQSPVFNESCPMYLEKTAPPGMRQALVIFQAPVATDNSGVVNVVRCVLESNVSWVTLPDFTLSIAAQLFPTN